VVYEEVLRENKMKDKYVVCSHKRLVRTLATPRLRDFFSWSTHLEAEK